MTHRGTKRSCVWLVGASAVLLFASPMPGLAKIIDLMFQPPDLQFIGVASNDETGKSVAFGDVNGDGRVDMIVGAPRFDYLDRPDCGAVFIILASDSLPTVIDLAAIRPDVKRIFGPSAGAQIGSILASGDLTGDARAEVLCGQPAASPQGRFSAGQIFVVFGDASPPDTVDLSVAQPLVTRIEGESGFEKLGSSLAVGDVNDDLVDDLVTGAPFAETSGGFASGKIYAIHGPLAAGTVVDLATTSISLTRVLGEGELHTLGQACYAHDVNDDGVSDIIGGAPQASPLGRNAGGTTYVIHGSAALPDTVDLATDGTVTRIFGPASGGLAGSSLAGGDVNGDGIGDIVIGVPELSPAGRTEAGSAFLLPGLETWPDSIDLATWPGTSRVDGPAANVNLGLRVATGDTNGDGFCDIVFGVPKATPAIGRDDAGKVFLVFGRNFPSPVIDLATDTEGTTVIHGESRNGLLGTSVDVVDADLDGFEDVFAGASGASGEQSAVGKAVIVRGGSDITPTGVVFYAGYAERDGVFLEWRLADDLDPSVMVVDRRSGSGTPVVLDETITRTGQGHYAFEDMHVEPDTEYHYRVRVTGEDPQLLFAITVSTPPLGLARLGPVYPNPFRGATRIAFDLPAAGRATIRLYDVGGRLVTVLSDGVFERGLSSFRWDGRGQDGHPIPSGVYFMTLEYGRQRVGYKLVRVF